MSKRLMPGEIASRLRRSSSASLRTTVAKALRCPLWPSAKVSNSLSPLSGVRIGTSNIRGQQRVLGPINNGAPGEIASRLRRSSSASLRTTVAKALRCPLWPSAKVSNSLSLLSGVRIRASNIGGRRAVLGPINNGAPGEITRRYAPRPFGAALRAFSAASRRCRTPSSSVGSSNSRVEYWGPESGSRADK